LLKELQLVCWLIFMPAAPGNATQFNTRFLQTGFLTTTLQAACLSIPGNPPSPLQFPHRLPITPHRTTSFLILTLWSVYALQL
jgi:hypothetical protein